MVSEAVILGTLILSVSCNKSEGGDTVGSAVATASGSAVKPGSGAAGGFSADLARELGSGGAAKTGGSAGTKADSDPAKAGSDTAKTGSDAAAMTGSDAPKAGSGAPAAGSNAAAMAGSGVKPAPAPKAGSDAPKTGSSPVASPVAVAGSAARPAPASAAIPPASATAAAPQATAPQAHGPVRVPAELAAIKLSLLPNWDRDVDEAGTFQYVVRIKGTQASKTFSFHYGYDDPKAPADRDQYKKYLQDTKLLVGELKDRQRGAAWFLEGTDASGLPAFRYLVLYGGKRLICYGSLYKDADASRLGDDRDQTVIQAKQICETLAL